MLSQYSSLQEKYTTYVVARKPGLPDGQCMQDMADDYAVMIREERRSLKNQFGKGDRDRLGRLLTCLAAIDARRPFGSRPTLAESTWRASPSSCERCVRRRCVRGWTVEVPAGEGPQEVVGPRKRAATLGPGRPLMTYYFASSPLRAPPATARRATGHTATCSAFCPGCAR
jgi:hypothetical protein